MTKEHTDRKIGHFLVTADNLMESGYKIHYHPAETTPYLSVTKDSDPTWGFSYRGVQVNKVVQEILEECGIKTDRTFIEKAVVLCHLVKMGSL